jgi:hypothetical protein
MANANRKNLFKKYSRFFQKYRNYTIILGTEIYKELKHLLDEEPDKTKYYYQYGELHLGNIKFISGLLKMQKYKDSHFLFTERILED